MAEIIGLLVDTLEKELTYAFRRLDVGSQLNIQYGLLMARKIAEIQKQ